MPDQKHTTLGRITLADMRPALGGAILGVITLHLAVQPLGMAPKGDGPDLVAGALGFCAAIIFLRRERRRHIGDES